MYTKNTLAARKTIPDWIITGIMTVISIWFARNGNSPFEGYELIAWYALAIINGILFVSYTFYLILLAQDEDGENVKHE